MGPVELLVIKFPGNQFKGEIAPALGELVESGTIRIIDLIFATKDENGQFDMVEVRDLESAEAEAFSNFLRGGNAMLSEEDVQYVASTLENGSSAAILLFEDTWATPSATRWLTPTPSLSTTSGFHTRQSRRFWRSRPRKNWPTQLPKAEKTRKLPIRI